LSAHPRSIKLEIRSNQPGKLVPIYLHISGSDFHFRAKTEFLVKPEFWSESKQELKPMFFILHELPDPFQTQVNLLKLTWKFDTRVEPHPFDEKDFASSNPVVNEILRTGIEISAWD
jgi:uncharacterized protein